MTHFFNGVLITVGACIASVGIIGTHQVNQVANAYEVDAYEYASYECDVKGIESACVTAAELLAGK